MLRFAANISWLYSEYPWSERCRLAVEDGFSGVEILFPYDIAPDTLASWLGSASIPLVLINCPPGDWAAGERGLLALPGREQALMAGVEMSIQYATRLGVTQLHCMAGILPAGPSRRHSAQTLLDNLRRVASRLQQVGLTLNIEPINTVADMPGYALDSVDRAIELIDAAGMPNIRLQFDAYHVRRMGQDVLAMLKRGLPYIGHVQLADVPGRGAPGTGSIEFAPVLELLQSSGYQGWISAEYDPRGDTRASLSWLRHYAGQ